MPLPATMHTQTTRGHTWDAVPKIEHFFQVYKQLEHKPVGTEGFADREEAMRVVDESFARARL